MSAIQEMIEADLDIFINPEEYAETHTIDGKEIKAVTEQQMITDRDGKQALSESNLNLYAKTEDLPDRKMKGESLYLDGVTYLVETWLEQMGITTVTLSYPEAY